MSKQVTFCNLCQRNVLPRKNFNILMFMLSLAASFFTLGMAPVVYVAYHLFLKRARCPICHSDSRFFSPARLVPVNSNG